MLAVAKKQQGEVLPAAFCVVRLAAQAFIGNAHEA